MSLQMGEAMKTTTIQARINPEVKKEAQKIFQQLNISMSEAINLYFTQVALNKGIPFDLKIPNKITTKTIDEAEKGKNIHSVDSPEELFEELDG